MTPTKVPVFFIADTFHLALKGHKQYQMKLLIIRFSSIGDIVLTSPVIRCLGEQRPDVSMHFLVKQNFKTVVEDHPYLEQIHSYTGELKPLIRSLQAEKFDLIIDLQ